MVTPLKGDRFHHWLGFHNLSHSFPTLVSNIYHGFPIGFDLPQLSMTITPKNYYLPEQEHIVQSYIDAEVLAGRISGPFSVHEAEQFFGGHFWSAPIGLVPKAGGKSDEWRMVQNLSSKLLGEVSVNSLIDSDDFPTSWGTAQMFADYVSKPFLSRILRTRICRGPQWKAVGPSHNLPSQSCKTIWDPPPSGERCGARCFGVQFISHADRGPCRQKAAREFGPLLVLTRRWLRGSKCKALAPPFGNRHPHCCRRS